MSEESENPTIELQSDTELEVTGDGVSSEPRSSHNTIVKPEITGKVTCKLVMCIVGACIGNSFLYGWQIG